MRSVINSRNFSRRKLFRKALLSCAIIASMPLCAALPAWADQLDDLRASGAVGEAFDGFARARDGSAQGFVDNLNEQRRVIYVKRAKTENVGVEQVGRVYAVEILKKAPAGTWFLSESGQWTQK
ncbi:YdbL family protein [Sneathiella sp. CAU 1612]|jgi:uncharacterized protein|uniref:YdbL family protein n=1 Tax=Sneathiella sedimenti TaxID=2816034 RepID=A0ABS3F5S0_9PROT|nr:YdbL family protein [Sneathiella sedimenti]MBO0333870.1 YdbL family protein [Sneathiella sedimenti]